MADEFWKHLRYAFIDNLTGTGPAGAAVALSAPGVVYLLRATTYTSTTRLALYDHTNLPLFPVTVMTPGVGVPDQTPPVPVGLPLQRGLYVSFSMGAGGTGLLVGWER